LPCNTISNPLFPCSIRSSDSGEVQRWHVRLLPEAEDPKMPLRTRINHRPGAAAVEAAIVLPVFILLFLAFILGGQMIANYERVACQAREASRWASVRGGDYFRETGNASPTRQQILDQVVLPLAAGMETNRIELTVQWIDAATGTTYDWDSSSKD